ncbi:hypothetical protein [Hydrogenophaga laconesensis]|uniref:Molecular chaperone DnaJ n=1 Tax=Hydrogenophaga laconesensis TaxID=1805971 RepID=A0ABU1VHE5_9BURK|nr:hypothetical protein [Hydrogenophaga laconesensis]MDR7096735.1 hypothetical protein [Hydrogenophaga laconesensis]
MSRSDSRAAALHVLPSVTQPPSAAARAYNLQLTRIDKLRSQLAEMEALAQRHRLALHGAVEPLRRQVAREQRALALALDGHLQGKWLSRVQADTARTVLRQLARVLAEAGDAAMRELHDRHSPRTLAQLRQDAADALRQRLESVLGEPLEDEGQNLSAEQLLRAGMERLRQAQEDVRQHRREAAQARRARKTPGALARQAEEHDADTLLRRLFRQLASALHPDRETDPQARLHKTALMSEANAAYEKRDLVALLQIQARAELADPTAVQRLSDERLALLTLLLKQQVAGLERERAARQGALAHEFDLPEGVSMNANTLLQSRIDQTRALERALAQLAQDQAQVDDPVRLKRWLNARRDGP